MGEEAEQTGPAVIRDVGTVAAPIDRFSASVLSRRDGARRCGREDSQDRPFFPGGTVDAFDVWLELKA